MFVPILVRARWVVGCRLILTFLAPALDDTAGLGDFGVGRGDGLMMPLRYLPSSNILGLLW